MKVTSKRKLAWRLVGAVIIAFVASMALTWILHEKMTKRSMSRLFDNVFTDVAVDIRERVDARMYRQAMALRDHVYEMREQPWWNDPDESSRRLRLLANELGVDEICVADAKGILTHSARRNEVGALDFVHAEGQAKEFASLLTDKYEVAQPLLPNTLRGDMVKYVGVWIPDGGFVQVGGYENSVRSLARTAVTGLTHGWHVSGDDGGIYITTGNGTIISHPEAGCEGGQWQDPGDDTYWEMRTIEGFPVYVMIPKQSAIVERRVLVATSAFLNGMALVLASILVGIVIAGYVRNHLAAQRKKEMGMAKSIQESAIPRVFPPFSEEPRMDVFATMQTARDVGGDFYDFYFSGPGRITFLVADVSGKGIPAALYMMRAKATIKGISQTGLPLTEVAAKANDALSRDNDANMFVTAWIGELDLATGTVTYVNAGHNPPVFMPCKAAPEYVRARSGMMFGAMPGLKYKAHKMTLSPGDMLYLYTDGITEQPDPKGELFGEERLLFAINTMMADDRRVLDRDDSPLLSALFRAVIVHGGGVEQADDCTQLLFRYNGDESKAASHVDSRSFAATLDGVASASSFLDETLEKIAGKCPKALALSPKLHIVLDEIASNIARYSKATGFDLTIEPLDGGKGIRLGFSDDGVEYNPLVHTDPDTSLPAEKRIIGGLGIMMVKKMSSSLAYKRAGNRNILVVELT